MADINSNLPVNDTSDGTVGAAVPLIAEQIGGKDGSGNLRPIKIDTLGGVVIGGEGVAGTPAGGVVSVQGVTGGTPVPVSLSTGTPTFSSKTRIETFTTDVSLAASTFTTIYTYTGSGSLIGFNFEFDGSATVVKLIIDGEVIFGTLTLHEYKGLLAATDNVTRYQAGEGIVGNDLFIDFSFRYPVKYNSTIVIQANPGASIKKFKQGIIYLTKET